VFLRRMHFYRRSRASIIQFIKKIKDEKGYERIGAVGLVPSQCRICPPPANLFLARYCFGGSMSGRLGSTDYVNTIVIAHPGELKPVDIRAIKVGNPTSNSCPSDSLICPFPLRFLLVGCWPKVTHDCSLFFRHTVHYHIQRT
jgi:hypothetical protein